jgi:hypothetical protein
MRLFQKMKKTCEFSPLLSLNVSGINDIIIGSVSCSMFWISIEEIRDTEKQHRKTKSLLKKCGVKTSTS